MRRRNRERRTRRSSRNVMAEIEALERQLKVAEGDNELEQWTEELSDEEAAIAEHSTGISVEESMGQNERAEKNWPVKAKTAARLLKLASALLEDEDL